MTPPKLTANSKYLNIYIYSNNSSGRVSNCRAINLKYFLLLAVFVFRVWLNKKTIDDSKISHWVFCFVRRLYRWKHNNRKSNMNGTKITSFFLLWICVLSRDIYHFSFKQKKMSEISIFEILCKKKTGVTVEITY